MKNSHLYRAAMGLWVLAVITASLLTTATVAKYTAISATDIATARVAKWDVGITTGIGRNGQYGFSYSNIPAVANYQAQTITFTVKNDSEVVAAFTPKIRYITTPHSGANVGSSSSELQNVSYSCPAATPASGSSGTAFHIPANTSATFTAIMPPATQYGNGTYRCRLYIDVAQVN